MPRHGPRFSSDAALLVGLTLLAVALRFWGVDRQSIWVDESFSIAWAGVFEGMTGERILQNLQGPFHSVLLFLWSRLFGPGVLSLRSLEVVTGAATVPLLYWALKPLPDRSLRLAAPAVLAISPFHIWYSQEIRNYVFVMTFAVLSMGAFLRLSGAGRRGWVLYTISNALGLLSNLNHAFVLITQGVVALMRPRWSRHLWRGLALSWAVTLLLLSPWIVQFWERRVEPSGALEARSIPTEERLRGATTSPALGIPYTYFTFSLGFSYGPSLRDLHELGGRDAAEILRPHRFALAWALLAFGVAASWGAFRLWRMGPAGRAWLALAVIPVLLTYLVATRNLKVFNPRYAAGGLPAFALVLAAGVTGPRRRAAGLVLAGAVLAPSLVSLIQLQRESRYAKEDARSVAEWLEREAGAGDLLFLVGTDLPFREYYWRIRGGRPEGLEVADAWHWVDLERTEQLRRFDNEVAAHRRTIVVFLRAKDVDPQGRWRQHLDQIRPEAEIIRFPGVEMRILEGTGRGA